MKTPWPIESKLDKSILIIIGGEVFLYGPTGKDLDLSNWNLENCGTVSEAIIQIACELFESIQINDGFDQTLIRYKYLDADDFNTGSAVSL